MGRLIVKALLTTGPRTSYKILGGSWSFSAMWSGFESWGDYTRARGSELSSTDVGARIMWEDE
jgi:hypothetical protein